MQPSDLDEEELLMMLSDVLTQVAAGQTEGHRCPVCDGADLLCQESDGHVKVQCGRCRLDFAGWLGG